MKRILVLVFLVLFFGSFVSAEHAAAADRFVNNNDGTVTDKQTGLMWADRDNGSNINWFNAKSYCEGYSGGGKSGWRMPTLDELGQLYNSGAYAYLIKRTGSWVWASDTDGNNAARLHLDGGTPGWLPQSYDVNGRARPVRSSR